MKSEIDNYQSQMLVHTEPTEEELRGLFRFLAAEHGFGFVDEALRDEESFVDAFLNGECSPMVFEWEGQCIGILWLTDYCYFPKSAFIHYAVSSRHGRPMMRAARAFIDAVLDGDDYRVLFAVFNEHDCASRRLSAIFGFTVFGEKDGKVYAVRI